MTPVLLISIAAFVGVAALVGGVAIMFRDSTDEKVEDRLAVFTSNGPAGTKKGKREKEPTLLAEPLNNTEGFFHTLLKRFGNVELLFEQADTKLTSKQFCVASGVMAIAGWSVALYAGIPVAFTPLAGLFSATLPLMWLLFRRRRRMKAFATQLPDALELIARALRAGHSLAAGMALVQEEMTAPIGIEFGRCADEHAFGVSLEDAMRQMCDRMPNLDLKFFATAVILQRQTGGDLAEILDKIGYLVRERFKIWGQVQALTGEGRLSGIVLLALPPALFAVVYKLNPDYVMVLFTDPMGKKMLAGAAVMQLLGALVIRKIVNIKV